MNRLTRGVRLPQAAMGLAAALTLGLLFYVLVDQGPRPQSQTLTLQEDQKISLTLRANKAGPEVEFRVVEGTSQGRLEGKLPDLRYIPDANFSGTDHFQFVTLYQGVASKPAWVNLEVEPVNDVPQAKNQTYEVVAEGQTRIQLEATDADGDFVSFRILAAPLHGRLEGEAPNLVYFPEPGFMGLDELRFQPEDLLTQGTPGVIRLQVGPRNDAPQAEAASYQTYRDQPLRLSLQASDRENDPLRFEVLNQPKQGTLVYEGQELVYQPKWGFLGRDSFLFIARDGHSPSAAAEVVIEVRQRDPAEDMAQRLKEFSEEGGILLGHYQTPELLLHEDSYIPASLTKLATAAAAQHYLGPGYKFYTEVYLDAGVLYLRGGGDPLLSAKNLHQIAQSLKEKGVFKRPLRALVADDTAFEIRPDFDGRSASLEPYDAPIGALTVNQNLGHVEVWGDRVVSLRQDTPLTEKLAKKSRGLRDGMTQFTLAANAREGAMYALEVAEAIFTRYGLRLQEPTRMGQVPRGAKPILRLASSRPLDDLLRQMLAESNNFIANELVMAMALKRYGAPARMEDGVYLINEFLQREVAIPPAEAKLVEGSGLSRQNHFTLSAMGRLLEYFRPAMHLMPELKHSPFTDLAKAGHHSRILAKTGTLEGVSNLAGYIYTENNQWKPFVIMLRQPKQNRVEVLDALLQTFP